MEDPMWVALFVWSTWLLIAIIIDGVMVPIKMYYSHKSIRKVEKEIKDKDLPLVSVVVPAYNEEKTIERCIVTYSYFPSIE
jgi:biofilm PGA synthesis N-glycosyltransferase PgaC